MWFSQLYTDLDDGHLDNPTVKMSVASMILRVTAMAVGKRRVSVAHQLELGV